jgi:hypothetical protein
MKLRTLSLGLLVLACASAANAETLLSATPLATPAKVKTPQTALRRLTPPTVTETTVSRASDGRLALNCAQKPNPKLKAAANAAAATAPRQP